jgi:hypothetical protein
LLPPTAPEAPAPPEEDAEDLAPRPSAPLLGPPYDAERPCFSVAQMGQAQRVLFGARAGSTNERWLRAINAAFHDLSIPCDDDGFLVLVLTTIQLESGVAADPALENTDLEALFLHQLRTLRASNPVAGKLLDYAGLDQAIQARLREDTQRGHVRTEGDLVRYVDGELRDWLTAHLQAAYRLPEGVARTAAEHGLPSPVGTLGPMQVNVRKAYQNARQRGEPVDSEAQMRDWMLDDATALERGVREGVYQLWRVYRFYRRTLVAQLAVRYATADYNAGEFSSRNAAFQERVATLTKRRLALDGDLLLYQDGQPIQRVSNTEAAVLTVVAGVGASRVRQDLLLEKTAAFGRTPTARQVCERYRRETGRACALATVPVGALNPVARVKLGRDYTPANYTRAYVRRWEENLSRYGAG